METWRRPRIYTPAVKATLLWVACGRIHSKRMVPYLPQIVSKGALKIRSETEKLLVQMSTANTASFLPPDPRGKGIGAHPKPEPFSKRRSLSELLPIERIIALDFGRWTLRPTAERASRVNTCTPCVPWMWPQSSASPLPNHSR